MLASRAVAALGIEGPRAESYGKAAAVGENGELEHAAAILHPKLGAPVRKVLGHGAALISSSKKRVAVDRAAQARSASATGEPGPRGPRGPRSGAPSRCRRSRSARRCPRPGRHRRRSLRSRRAGRCRRCLRCHACWRHRLWPGQG